MLELAKNLLANGYDAHRVMQILVNGGLPSLEAAQIMVEALTPTFTDKVQMKEIKIIRHEGTGDFDGFTTDNWDHFNSILEKIAQQHGDDCGYTKTKFNLTWADGETYEGRLDVNTKDDKKVGKHILDFLNFHTGEHCPDHLTQEEYTRFLDDCGGEEGKQDAKDYLAKYEIVV